MTPQQRENLEKLATYLEQLPVDYKHFDMGDYYNGQALMTDEQLTDYALNNGGVDKYNCGAVACAVGHGPSAGILFKPSEITWYNAPDWNKYSLNFIAETGNLEYQWLFGSEWENVDNTHRGAAARIRYLLDGKPPRRCGPDDYSDDQHHLFEMEAADMRATYAEYLV